MIVIVLDLVKVGPAGHMHKVGLMTIMFPMSNEKADADFVRQQSGFAIGGVPPVGHAQPIAVFIDEDLLTYSEIWAAAGTPQAVFRLTPRELQKITNGRVICVK
jgi:prolyl-tRNA editing enzyme YbaK/EbsC (Cys-tRNA(Pro) deacylase)